MQNDFLHVSLSKKIWSKNFFSFFRKSRHFWHNFSIVSRFLLTFLEFYLQIIRCETGWFCIFFFKFFLDSSNFIYLVIYLSYIRFDSWNFLLKDGGSWKGNWIFRFNKCSIIFYNNNNNTFSFVQSLGESRRREFSRLFNLRFRKILYISGRVNELHGVKIAVFSFQFFSVHRRMAATERERERKLYFNTHWIAWTQIQKRFWIMCIYLNDFS